MAGALVKLAVELGARRLGLSSAQYHLLLVLSWLAGSGTGECCVSAEGLAETTGMSERSVKYALDALCGRRYARKWRVRNGSAYRLLVRVETDRAAALAAAEARAGGCGADGGAARSGGVAEGAGEGGGDGCPQVVDGGVDNPSGSARVALRNASGSATVAPRKAFGSAKYDIPECNGCTPEGGIKEFKLNKFSFSPREARGERKRKLSISASAEGLSRGSAAGSAAGCAWLTLAEATRLAKTNGWRPCTDRGEQERCNVERQAVIEVAYSKGLPAAEAVAWADWNAEYGWERVTGGNSVMSLLNRKLADFRAREGDRWMAEQERRREAARLAAAAARDAEDADKR